MKTSFTFALCGALALALAAPTAALAQDPIVVEGDFLGVSSPLTDLASIASATSVEKSCPSVFLMMA